MNGRSTITIGTRGSALALWQAQWVRDRLTRLYPATRVELKIMKTTGDKILDAPLSKIGDKGLFTKELENALDEGAIDLAVHSLKDVPTRLPEGLMIAAICEREDARDVFVPHPKKRARKLDEVPRGGTVATGSLRRSCQLLAARPDLRIADIRGNLETRIRKLAESDWDGMLLAYAGVLRLGKKSIIGEVLPMTTILPAVGQGALGIESRMTDEMLHSMLAPLDHDETRQAVLAERALLRKLEGGCQIPIGAYGRIVKGEITLDAIVGALDGSRVIKGSITGPADDAEILGAQLARQLLRDGASEILAQLRAEHP
jgi:hydroxymethylbilane synthase